MIQQNDIGCSLLVFVHENVARMRVRVNISVEENHLWVKHAQLIGHIERIDIWLFDVLQIVHLSTFEIFHHENTIGRQVPMDLRNFQPFHVSELRANLAKKKQQHNECVHIKLQFWVVFNRGASSIHSNSICTHSLSVSSLRHKVQLFGNILLRLVDEPLKLEIGKDESHDFDAILHR